MRVKAKMWRKIQWFEYLEENSVFPGLVRLVSMVLMVSMVAVFSVSALNTSND